MIVKLKNITLNDTPKCRSAGSCTVCYAGRMGETVYAQRHSKVSECGQLHGLLCWPHGRNSLCSTTIQSVGGESEKSEKSEKKWKARKARKVENRKTCMFNGAPKSRDRAVVRFVLPAPGKTIPALASRNVKWRHGPDCIF